MTVVTDDRPLVSILIVARNAAAYIDAAIRSARCQTRRDIEIIVVDDGSQDATGDIAGRHAAADGRVRLVAGPRLGLSAVRNVSLREARGRYAAILDADDVLDPGHVELLIEQAESSEAEICAANMVEFTHGAGTITTRPFSATPSSEAVRDVSTEEYLEGGMIGARSVSFGYLKPLFNLDFLRANGIEYDQRLRIGEDFDIVLRAMLCGARYSFSPRATYFYRRHDQSTSHRLGARDLEGLSTATREYRAADASLKRLISRRLYNLEGSMRQLQAIDALRCGHVILAAKAIGLNRDAMKLVLGSLGESCLKRLGLWNKASPHGAQASEAEDAASRYLRAVLAPTPATS